jgi:WD40 repeat protein
MNYHEFICDYCNLYIENPIILPCCWSTICKEHENDFVKKNDSKFKCPTCNIQQPIPQNGFFISTNLINLIKNGDHLGKNQKKLFNSIAKLESKIKEYKSINSEEIIYDYFSNLRNQIDLLREEKIEQIKKESKEIICDQAIEQIHLKSEELLAFLKQEEEKCKENTVIKNAMLEDPNPHELSSWKNLLRKPDFKEDEAAILLNKIKDKINQINHDISNNNNGCFMNKKIKFFPSKLNNYLGELETNTFKISSNFGKLIKNFKVNGAIYFSSIQVIEDQNKLISAYDTIKIWDLQSGKCLRTLDVDDEDDAYPYFATSVLIYKNNKFISAGFNGIKIWDLESFKCIETFKNNSRVIFHWPLLLLSDNILASGSGHLEDGIINIWNFNEKKIVKSIKAHEASMYCLIKSKDSSKFISGSEDSKIKIWDSNNFQLLKELNGHSSHICCLKILNDETCLSGSSDKSIKIWNIDSGVCLKTLKFNSSVRSIETFNNDRIIIAGKESGVTIFNLNKYKKVCEVSSDVWSGINEMILLSNGNLLTFKNIINLKKNNIEIKLFNLLELE